MTPWLGVFAPAATPQAVLARVRNETNRLLADADFRERLRGLGGLEPFVTTPEEFAALLREEHARYGAIVRAAGGALDPLPPFVK